MATLKNAGLSKTPTYLVWNAMRRRVNIKRPYYDHITVCDRWQEYSNFLEDMGERPSGMTLDRIDNSVGYCPENCRWASHHQQFRNRRSNRWLSMGGETLCILDWSRLTGIGDRTIAARLDRGWSVEDALTKPVRPMNKTN